MLDDVRLLTAKEAADLLRLTPDSIYKLAKKGKLPSVRVSGSVRFRVVALRQWLEKQEQQETTR